MEEGKKESWEKRRSEGTKEGMKEIYKVIIEKQKYYVSLIRKGNQY